MGPRAILEALIQGAKDAATVAVAVEAMRKLGVEFHAAHLFAFYFAAIADITPPVAIAAFAGANIAGSDPFRTGLEASKIAIAGSSCPSCSFTTPP